MAVIGLMGIVLGYYFVSSERTKKINNDNNIGGNKDIR